MAEAGQPQVGDMPPQPATWRGRVGAVLVKGVRRMLFWYTDQIRAQNKRIAEAAREQARAFHQLSAGERKGREALADLTQRLAEQEQVFEERLRGIRAELLAMRCRFEENERQAGILRDQQGEAVRALAAQLNGVAMDIPPLRERLSGVERGAASLQRAEGELTARLAAIDHELQHAKTRLTQQEAMLKALLPERTPDLDHLFAEHARAFRGERAEIRRRLGVYLPYAQKAFAEAENLPALDLGCGRGEWLEILREAGIPARGIDANREFISTCRELGLEAEEGDLPQALRSLTDGSCAIVTAIHVLEHLTFRDLLEVVDQSLRILKPGGIAIFETPNPKNLVVSSSNFYLDPTHHHPLPSELLAFIVQARGFRELEVLPLAQYAEAERLQEEGSAAAAFLNEHFFGAQDYGIVAKKC
jgi:O-antigen chain-terminating methyltransferase